MICPLLNIPSSCKIFPTLFTTSWSTYVSGLLIRVASCFMVGKDHKWGYSRNGLSYSLVIWLLFLEIPPPWGLTLQFILPSTWELLNPQEDMHRFNSLFSFTAKSNPLYGQAANMGTCLQVVERTWVQVYRPTLSFTLWVLCLLHAKYSIHPGYEMFLTGLENTFLLCSGDQPKKHWWFTLRMRSPKLRWKVIMLPSTRLAFFTREISPKSEIENKKIENEVIWELSNRQKREGKTLKKSPDLYI